MLNEIELLVGAGSPEILPVVHQLLVLLFALLVGDGDGGFFAEGRVGQHIVHPVAGVCQQSVPQGDGDVAVNIADVVQVQIHQRHFEGVAYQLVAVEGLVFQKLLFLPGELVVFRVCQKFLCRQEEAAAAAAGVGYAYKNDTITRLPFSARISAPPLHPLNRQGGASVFVAQN